MADTVTSQTLIDTEKTTYKHIYVKVQMSLSLTKIEKNEYQYNRSSSIEYNKLCSFISSKYGNNKCIVTSSGMSAIDLAFNSIFVENLISKYENDTDLNQIVLVDYGCGLAYWTIAICEELIKSNMYKNLKNII